MFKRRLRCFYKENQQKKHPRCVGDQQNTPKKYSVYAAHSFSFVKKRIFERLRLSYRHCEEPSRRSNPETRIKDWIASLRLAMTGRFLKGLEGFIIARKRNTRDALTQISFVSKRPQNYLW
jgi:hypothetical protein